MAHEIANVNGQASMMYTGETPWHGLGTRLDNPATAHEAIVAAGLDYEVELTRLATVDGVPVPQRVAAVRADTQDVLGVVSPSYVPVQNSEAFGFLDAVAAEGGISYHTAGALRRGERIWLLGKLPGEIRVRGSEDITEKFLLLSNSHDGSSSLRVFFSPIRVVCANTLAVAERGGKGEGIAIRHRGNLAYKVRAAQETLGLAMRFYDDLEGQIDLLANHYPSAAQLEAYFRSLYPDPEEGSPSRAKSARETLFALFERGMGNDIPQIRHSTWAALNGVTEFVDHRRSGRGRDVDDRASSRLESVWFGGGAALKARAFDLAMAMASDN